MVYPLTPPESRPSIEAFLALAKSGHTVVFPAHPRTQKHLSNLRTNWYSSLLLISPVSYLDMLVLESKAYVILTDSGGVQKEAYWLSVPCVTLRDETEWLETVESGWNLLAGTQIHKIIKTAREAKAGNYNHWPWGKGEASKKVVEILLATPS